MCAHRMIDSVLEKDSNDIRIISVGEARRTDTFLPERNFEELLIRTRSRFLS